MDRRTFLAAAPLAFSARRRPPNIVFIMADDLGYGHVGCYGQRVIRTPNIDKLATEGTRYTDAYAGCTVCAPSRSVLMTGLHSGHTSVRSNPGGVPLLAEDVTVAQVLHKAGYVSGLFGKWGLGDEGTTGVPNKHGFDEFFGYLNQVHAHIYYPEFLYRNEQRYPLPGNANHKRGQYAHDVIFDRALDFVRRYKDRPFFLCATPTLPHWELVVPEDSLREYRGRFPETPFRDPGGHYSSQDYPRAAFAGMVTRLDRDVGRMMALLRELGLEQDTIVFFTSDNGAQMIEEGFPNQVDTGSFFHGGGPFRDYKGNMYEGGIRVPMIVRWPGRIRAGAVSDFPWAFWDVLPTFAALAGVEAPRGIDGISVAPMLTGEGRQQRHEFLYWENPRYRRGTFLKETPMQAVRMGDWKAVRPRPDGPLELYSLKDDIAETTNVAAKHPEVLAKIEAYLKTARTEPRPQSGPPTDWWKKSS
ncbi:MAG: arylsulfatase [Acidobacteria bacterium]|nr:arylsulfatase [Acidobacteriota bacterium]